MWPKYERKPESEESAQYQPRWVRKGFTEGFAENTLFEGLRINDGHFENLVNRHIKCVNRHLRMAKETLRSRPKTTSTLVDINQNHLKSEKDSAPEPLVQTSPPHPIGSIIKFEPLKNGMSWS